MPDLPARNPRAFREHDHPGTPAQQAFALFGHFLKSLFAQLAIDVDHIGQANAPTEKRDVQQLFFEHIGQRARHDQRQQKGFQLRLVLDQQDGRQLLAVGADAGQIFHAGDTPVHATNGTQAVNRPRQKKLGRLELVVFADKG